MSLPQEDHCYILKLPNEVLSNILSNVILPPHSLFLLRVHENKISDSPFHSVRSVCRHFRAIVAELPFWYDPSFDIGKFKPAVRKPEPDDFVGFYSNLFTDTRIVRTLHQ